jgi:uncharacterized protein
MSVPNRLTAARLLLSVNPPAYRLRHSRAVAEVAGWLAARIAANGIPIDRALVEAAALLHDVDKTLPKTDPVRALPHGDGGAEWLTGRGHPELARAVANHPVTRLADEERYRQWSAFATREERIVAYADKRAGQRLEPMAARFARWRRRYPPIEEGGSKWDGATLERIWLRAQRLELDVCRAANVRPDEVERLRWTAAAFRGARAAGPDAGEAPGLADLRERTPA